MNEISPKRIIFYSHDTFGLGHIRRTQKLANEIAGTDKSILIICASPKASSYSSSNGIEYLNLPGFTKQPNGQYVPRALNVPIDSFVNLRSSLILSAVRSFQPDVLIIDKEPLGVKRELLPSLEFLRQNRKNCKIVCGFRDILDEKSVVLDEWDKRDTTESLKRYFDHLIIYGNQQVYDFAKEYDLDSDLASKIVYTGYVHPQDNINKTDFSFNFADPNLPVVTLTLGGGGDGSEILDTWHSMLESKKSLPFNHYILTGPFADVNRYERLKKLEDNLPNLKVDLFNPDTFSVFEKSDLVVSMGGYNTMIELAAMGKKPLILPRVKPRKEQLIRAEVFKEKNLCQFMHPELTTPESIWATILATLESKDLSQNSFKADGLKNFKQLFQKGIL